MYKRNRVPMLKRLLNTQAAIRLLVLVLVLLGEINSVSCNFLDRISAGFGRKRLATRLVRPTGANVIEASITIIVFVLFTLGLIDLSRYFIARAVLEYAAFEGANLAAKLELEVDTSDENCQESPSECDDYKKRIEVISDTVLKTANIVSNAASASGGLQRVKFRSFYEGNQKVSALMGAADFPPESEVAIMRPGEKLLMLLPDNTSKEIDHPTRSFSQGWPAQGENWRKILDDRNPIGIHLGAVFKPITPMMPEMVIHITQWANRRPKVFGAPIPKLPATATPNISPTPTPLVTPTNSAMPTATSTRTPIQIVDEDDPTPLPTASPTSASSTATPTRVPLRTFGDPDLLEEDQMIPARSPTQTSCPPFDADVSCAPAGCCHSNGPCGVGSPQCTAELCQTGCSPTSSERSPTPRNST